MNIKKELLSDKKSKFNRFNNLQEVKELKLIGNGEDSEILKIATAMGSNNSISRALTEKGKVVELVEADKTYKGDVYLLEQIKKLCFLYNLEFHVATDYCGNMELKTAKKVKEFIESISVEDDKMIKDLSRLCILAPSKAFDKSKNRGTTNYNPAVFYYIKSDKYRLIHNWGGLFTPKQRLQGLYWKSRGHMCIFQLIGVFFLSAFLISFFTDPISWWLLLALIPMIGILISIYVYENDTNRLYPDELFHKDKWADNNIKLNLRDNYYDY